MKHPQDRPVEGGGFPLKAAMDLFICAHCGGTRVNAGRDGVIRCLHCGKPWRSKAEAERIEKGKTSDGK